MSERLPVTLLVNTRNAAALLEPCLASCADWVSETLVVDMESDDDSVAIARAAGARVIEIENRGFVEAGRQVGIDAAEQPWVLILDADETAAPGMRKLLADYIAEGAIDGAFLPRRNWFFGKPIKESGFWPDYQMRFFRRDRARQEPRIHTHIDVSGNVVEAAARDDHAILHQAYRSIGEFIERTNRYTDYEIERMPPDRRFSLVRLLLYPPAHAADRFIRYRGYRDGRHGLAIAVLIAIYQAIVELKLWQARREER